MSEMATGQGSAGCSVLSCEELLLSRFDPGSEERQAFRDFVGGAEDQGVSLEQWLDFSNQRLRRAGLSPSDALHQTLQEPRRKPGPELDPNPNPNRKPGQELVENLSNVRPGRLYLSPPQTGDEWLTRKQFTTAVEGHLTPTHGNSPEAAHHRP